MRDEQAIHKKKMDRQLEKYGGPEGFSKEMSRRVSMRKKVGFHGFADPEVAKKAAAKSAEVRSKNAKKKRALKKLKLEANKLSQEEQEKEA